jgi:hypothetical protein
MPGENDLGDLIVTLKLDDSQYREDVKKVIGDTEALIKQTTKGPNFGGALASSERQLKKVIPLHKELNLQAQEAHQRFGVMANAVTGASTTLRLFGIESGFAVVEAGRMILYLGRATTAAGSVTAAFVTMASATKGFLVSILPITPILTALAVAYIFFRGKTEEATDAQKGLNAEFKKTRDELSALALKSKLESPTTSDAQKHFARIEAIQKRFPGTPATVAAQMMELEDRLAFDKAGGEASTRTKALKDEILILQNKRTIYDSIENKEQRMATILRDRLKLEIQRSELLDKESAQVDSFGIGTLPSSGFRFGAGAIGSVIGEQTETKKTNALLEKSLTKLDAQITELRKLTEPSASDN